MTHLDACVDCPAPWSWPGRILRRWLIALMKWIITLWRLALLGAAVGVTPYPAAQIGCIGQHEDARDTARNGCISSSDRAEDSDQGECAEQTGWTGGRDQEDGEDGEDGRGSTGNMGRSGREGYNG